MQHATRAQIVNAETELASLPPARPAADLQAEIDGLLLGAKTKGCTEIDNATQDRICQRVATLKAEKARAERRAELEATIASSTRQWPSCLP
jgi:hypothetical protein